MANNNTYKRPVIVWGNSFYINIALQKFVEGEYTDFDLTKVTDLKVYLICATHNTEIPLDYEIIPGIDNVLRCFVDYRLLHTTSYGIVVEGYDEHDIHFRFSMLPKEGFLVVNNTSGMQVTDEVQVVDISARVGWGIQTDGDLTNYYTKTEVDNIIAGIEVEIGDIYTKEEINQLLTQYPTKTEINTRFNDYYTKTQTDNLLNQKANKSELATVATTGDYNDLINKPNLNNYATKSDLNNYYDKGQTDGMLNSKVDTSTLVSEYYNKNTVNNLLDAKADTSDLNDFYDKQETNTLLNQKANVTDLNTKQDTLVSGTNIKTINNQSLLGSGNIDIQGGGGTQVQADWNETDTTDPAYIKNKPDLSIYAESSNLATVATSGDYDDLINKPTIQEPGFVKFTNPNVAGKVGLVNSLTEYYSTNIGNHAVIEGEGNNDNRVRASGNYSHAEGYRTIAGGTYSHAEGYITTTTTYNAHAEGSSTTASGTSSHAEGHNNTASGNSSHAEGENTTSSGHQSHSEGLDTQATGNHSHAEGSHTYATGLNAHAEGAGSVDPRSLPSNTTDTSNNGLEARGEHSHAEGWATKAFGNKSHAEGERSIASGNMAHAEGFETIASGLNSHAEGLGTRATNDDSHAEGWETQATGHEAHAEGAHTIANGNCSHAEGGDTVTRNLTEHASGRYNISTALGTQDFDPTSDTATLFSVGNGTANERHNAFEIKMNGDIYLNDGTKLQDQLGGNDEVTANALYDLNSRLSTAEYNINTIPADIDSKIIPVNERVDDISNDVTDLTNDIDNANLANSLILTELHNEIDDKQDELVSGTNIKTINGNSLLGSGDITIGGGQDTYTVKIIPWTTSKNADASDRANYRINFIVNVINNNNGQLVFSSIRDTTLFNSWSTCRTYIINNYNLYVYIRRNVYSGLTDIISSSIRYSSGNGYFYFDCSDGISLTNLLYTQILFQVQTSTQSSTRLYEYSYPVLSPTKISELPNDAGYISSSTSGLKIEIVQALPQTPDANTIYIIQ